MTEDKPNQGANEVCMNRRAFTASILGTALVLVAFFPTTEQAFAAEYTIHPFQKMQLTDEFWSEGANFGDFNRDGHNDIVSDPYCYECPDVKKRHEFRPACRVEVLQVVIDPKDCLRG